MFKIYSFDIFDTLITRKTATPPGIFLIIQYYLRNDWGNNYPVNLIEDFYQIRIDAEDKARKKSPFEETTLDEIYRTIQNRFQLSSYQTERLKELEINTELEYIVGIRENISKVINLIDSGKQVILISDMYLSAKDIGRMLEKIEPRLLMCPIYVSSEQKISKQTGNLFKQILKEYKIEAKQLFHYGDNINSDFRIPQKIGIRAELYIFKAISEFEQIYFEEDRLYVQLVAGISKIARINLSEVQKIEKVGICYSGPLLYAYTEFVLQSAINQNLKKIYFLSRDGHILLKIAKIINEKGKLNLDLQYLHVSRQVCYLASMFEITSKECEWILDFMDNIQTLAERFNLNPDTLIQLFNSRLTVKITDIKEKLSVAHRHALCNLLINNEEINNLFLQKANEFRTVFLEYMQQNNIFSDMPFAMVDIGWSGKMQDSLYKTLSFQKSGIKINYFYFGMYNSGYQKFTKYTSQLNQKNYFLEHPMKVRTHATFFEVITCTNHGTTISYARNENGKIIPILDPYLALSQWDINAYQNQILYFASLFKEIKDNFPNMRNYNHELAFKMKTQAEKPIQNILETVGDFPFTMGHNESKIDFLAPPISFKQIVSWSINRKNDFSYWIDGSLSRSKFIVKSYFYIFNKVRMNIRILKNFVFHAKQSFKKKLKRYLYRINSKRFHF